MRYLVLIPLLPAFGALVNGLVGVRFFSKRVAALLACTTMGLAFGLSVKAFVDLLALPAEGRDVVQTVMTWIPAMPLQTSEGMGRYALDWALRLDPLSAVMILVVTGIGFLIHVYSTAYMHDETRAAYNRFFTYMNLFCFFMLTLVLGTNFVVMFVGWEGVGLCSYLLIGFYYQKQSASDAGKKAFLTNRVGDFGFMLGMFLVFFLFGTLDFRGVAEAVALRPVESAGFGGVSLAALLLFVGATGKSAQIPLYVWLPDAMEGPTPVSALIHAATMVTAGVYMVARNAVLFEHAPIVMTIVAVIGVLTALMAATIGLVQNDIKRVLAYSTVSQLGYMFLATGVGAFAAGIFHLMTHAFFKALLFLGSGSVIHAMNGEQDMRKMGALKSALPITFITMLVGTLAIAGIPPLAGFFSKDEILYRTFLGQRGLWLLAAITAGLTAFYMWRLMSMTFFGTYRGPAYAGAHGGAQAHDAHAHDAHASGGHGHGHGAWHGPHESPRAMTWPLIALAVGAAVAGFVGVPAALWGNNAIEHFLEPSFTAHGTTQVAAGPAEARPYDVAPAAAHDEAPAAAHDVAPAAAHDEASSAAPAAGAHGAAAEGHEEHSTTTEVGLMLLSVAIAVFGIGFARHAYVTRPEISERLAARFPTAHRVLSHKYYVDEFYGATVIRATMLSATLSSLFDRYVIDGIVNGAGWLTRFSSWFSGLFDRYIVDGAVNGTGALFDRSSHAFRRVQTGLIQNYALVMLFGVFTFVSVYLLVR